MNAPGPCATRADGHAVLDDYLSRVRVRLDSAFREWIPEMFRDFTAPQTAAMQTAFGAGKRLRGALACLVCEALGGGFDDAMPGALAIEGLHCASLIHDDFVDGDERRRSQAATWTLEGARQAVLLGDIMFANLVRESVEASPDAGIVVARAIAQLARGAYEERREVGARRLGGRPLRYPEIVTLKTGALFAAAAELGALAAGAGSNLKRDARRFGEDVGVAYQIADDAVDLTRFAQCRDVTPEGVRVASSLLLEFSDLDAEAVGALGETLVQPQLWPAPLLETVRWRMDDAIAKRTSHALDALHMFPAGVFAMLLRSLPGAAVDLMRREVPAR